MVMSLIESLTRIKNAVYGREVREAIHDGVFRANQIADGADAKADNTQIRQDNLEVYNDQMIQEMTDKDVISAPEIIMSRNGEPTLADRLDRDFGHVTDNLTYVTTQIERTENDLASRSVSVKNPPTPMVAALGDGVTDDTDSIQTIINYASGIGVPVYVPTGTYKLNGVLTINRSSTKLIGESRKTVFDFTGQADTGQTALTVSECLYVDISGIRFNGDRAINGLALLGSVEAGVVDSVFRDCLFSGFDIGLVTSRAWNNLFEGTRFRNSRILAMFGTETNSTLFNKCSFTGSDFWHMTFESNAGLTFNTCNFENMNGSGMQVGNGANLTFVNPYFEHAAINFMDLGLDFNNGNETITPSYVYIFGSQFASQNFKVRIHSPLITLKMTGRVLGSLDILNRTNWTTRTVGGDVDIDMSGLNVGAPETIYEATGGSVFSHGDSGNAVLSSAISGSGTILTGGNLRMATGLVSGETYLLKVKAKRAAGFSALSLTDGTRTFAISHLLTNKLKEITIPIKADATLGKLDLIATGGVYFEHIILSKGVNTPKPSGKTQNELKFPTAPTAGSWTVGQIINNSAPAKGVQRGWVCVTSGSPGVWEGLGII